MIMELEIKFRGKRADNGEWVYGYFAKLSATEGYILTRNMDWFSTSKVDISSIGQYTGLKDRNGKEIYEGDFVRYIDANDEPKTSEVRFVDAAFSPLTEIMWMGDADCEVVGNKFDNPEMMK